MTKDFTVAHRKLLREIIMEDFDIKPSRASVLIHVITNVIRYLDMFYDEEEKNETES